MKLTQNFHGSVGNVYNVDGTLILSADSKAPDLIRELVSVRAQIAALPGLAAPVRQQVESSLDAATAEGQAGRPNGTTIKAHLDSAAGTLDSATEVAERASKLAGVLGGIGKWAVALFS